MHPCPLILAHGTLAELTGSLHAALPMHLPGTILASTPAPAPSAICRSTTIALHAEVVYVVLNVGKVTYNEADC